jgi:hypothetical protein
MITVCTAVTLSTVYRQNSFDCAFIPGPENSGRVGSAMSSVIDYYGVTRANLGVLEKVAFQDL